MEDFSQKEQKLSLKFLELEIKLEMDNVIFSILLFPFSIPDFKSQEVGLLTILSKDL